MDTTHEASIFLSHRAADEAAALAIKKVLEKQSDRLEVHVFEQQAAGRPWEEWIRETLRQSHLLLLLYTDSTADWDWCLYEAGWFTPLRTELVRPVVCLYSPETSAPPKPLKTLQAVKADRKELVNRFLRPLYHTSDLIELDKPLNDRLEDEDLLAIAEHIVAHIAPAKIEVEKRFYQESIMVELPDLDFVEQAARQPQDAHTKIPKTATVEALRGRLGILDFDESHFTWGDLVERADQTRGYGTYWLDEVALTLVAAAQKRTPRVGTATFRGLKEGKIYRASLYRVDKENKVPRRFYIGFNQEIKPEMGGGPGQIGLAFNLLRLGNRLRWEVVDPFLRRLDRATAAQQLEVVCRQLFESIEAIEDDAERHDHLNAEALRALFSDEALIALEPLVGEWRELRRALAEELAASEPSREVLRTSLEAIRRMNRQLMAATAEVYHRLLDREWQAVAPEANAPTPEVGRCQPEPRSLDV